MDVDDLRDLVDVDVDPIEDLRAFADGLVETQEANARAIADAATAEYQAQLAEGERWAAYMASGCGGSGMGARSAVAMGGCGLPVLLR